MFGSLLIKLSRTGEKTRMGKMEKEKGKRGEREAAKALEEHLGIKAYRGRQFSGSPDSPDVKTSLPRIHFEVSREERFSYRKKMAQAEKDAGPSEIPVVLHRYNGEGWVVVVKLKDLEDLAICVVQPRRV